MLLLITSCMAHTASVVSVQHTIQLAQPVLQQFSAHMHITYFGVEGRIKTTGSLLAALPNQLRWQLDSPHGGILLAFASDSNNLYALDFKSSTYITGPATAAHIDSMLGFVPLGLSMPEWVDVFFGMFAIPPDAIITASNTSTITLAWSLHAIDWQLIIDTATMRPITCRTSRQQQILWQVDMSHYNHHGLPEMLYITSKQSNTDIAIRLSDINTSPHVAAFVLKQPSGWSMLQLD